MYPRHDYEDIAHEAWILALRRGYYDPKILREAARNLKIFQAERSVEEMTEAGIEFPTLLEPDLDERIALLREDPRFKDTIEKILSGVNICTAVKKYSSFIRQARRAVAQPRLF